MVKIAPGIQTPNKLFKNSEKIEKIFGNNGQNNMEQNFSPVSNILGHFYFMIPVLIATQSALNRYPDLNFQILSTHFPIDKFYDKALYSLKNLFNEIIKLAKYQTNFGLLW